MPKEDLNQVREYLKTLPEDYLNEVMRTYPEEGEFLLGFVSDTPNHQYSFLHKVTDVISARKAVLDTDSRIWDMAYYHAELYQQVNGSNEDSHHNALSLLLKNWVEKFSTEELSMGLVDLIFRKIDSELPLIEPPKLLIYRINTVRWTTRLQWKMISPAPEDNEITCH